jgi:hypothetical protein
MTIKRRDTIVGIATGSGLDDRGVGVRVPSMVKDFLFSTSSRSTLGSTQPPIQWVLGAISPGVKRTGREADHLTPTNAEVKKTWVYTSTSPYAFIAKCLINYAQGQFYLYLQWLFGVYMEPFILYYNILLINFTLLYAWDYMYLLQYIIHAAARVRVRAACGFCGGKSDTGAGFLRVLQFPLPIIPPISPLS